MRRFFLTISLLLSISGLAFGQSCYNSTRAQALRLMEQQKYTQAIEYFKAADDCPDKPDANDLASKIDECRRAIRAREERSSGNSRTQTGSSSSSARLTIDKTRIQFSAFGGESVVYVNTNASSWETWGVPTWCYVVNKNSSGFTLVCRENTSSQARSDYMKVKAGGKEVRIDISQSGSSGRSALEITRVTFANGDKNGNVLTEYGGVLRVGEMKYLLPKVYYNLLTPDNKSIDIKIKIIKPDGSISSGSESPSGFTWEDRFNFSSGNSRTINLKGWGSVSGGVYPVGVHRFEIWSEGKKLYSTTFEIKGDSSSSSSSSGSTRASRLTVDNKTLVNATFSSSGGSETFYVSTDASSWTTWGIPTWCSVVEKTSSSFKLKCEPNRSSSSRSDYMKIKAGDKEVRINITQSGNSSSSAYSGSSSSSSSSSSYSSRNTSKSHDSRFRVGVDISYDMFNPSFDFSNLSYNLGAGFRARIGGSDQLFNLIGGIHYHIGAYSGFTAPVLLNLNFAGLYIGGGYEFSVSGDLWDTAVFQTGICASHMDYQIYYKPGLNVLGFGLTWYW